MATDIVEDKKIDWETTAEWLDRNKGLVSRSLFYRKVDEGIIPVLRVGRKILVRADALDRLFEHQLEEAGR